MTDKTKDDNGEAVTKKQASVAKLAPRPPVECPYTELRPEAACVHHLQHEVKHGVTLEDVLRPRYWKNLWRQLARAKNTRLTVICEDGSWEAELRVVSTGEGFAKCRVLNEWHMEKKPGRKKTLPNGWTIDYVSDGWRVRNADGEVITSGHSVQEDAVEAALQFRDKVA